MEQPKHVSRWIRSVRLSLAVGLVIALFIASTVRPAGAQTGNTLLGTNALGNNTSGSNNTALGFFALFENTTANDNTAVGANALVANISSFNTATGASALQNNATGFGNTAAGFDALLQNTTGAANTATGFDALQRNTAGHDNTASGSDAMADNTLGSINTATGENTLAKNTTGSKNTAMGFAALANNSTGNFNIAVGYIAGSNLTGDNNIDIGNEGVAGESNVIRIGTKGTQTRTLIAGITGSPVFVGSQVLVNANGRLGVPVSSARYKRDIRDMGSASARLMKLRPVTFRYKEDPNGMLQYGLVAEEVVRVYPELVTYGEDGKPLSVAYQMLPAMLLNELQKQVIENRWKDTRIVALNSRSPRSKSKSTLCGRRRPESTGSRLACALLSGRLAAQGQRA
jgi:hypothetical protein